jgi:hypothetical protein
MVDKQTAIDSKHGDFFYCVNANHISRFRVTGKVKTWKTRPTEFRIPIKFGLYGSYEITDKNAHIFYSNVQTAIAEHPTASIQKGLV